MFTNNNIFRYYIIFYRSKPFDYCQTLAWSHIYFSATINVIQLDLKHSDLISKLTSFALMVIQVPVISTFVIVCSSICISWLSPIGVIFVSPVCYCLVCTADSHPAVIVILHSLILIVVGILSVSSWLLLILNMNSFVLIRVVISDRNSIVFRKALLRSRI